MSDAILIALEEAAVEVRFRLEDARKYEEKVAALSVGRTLTKIRAAIRLRKQELQDLRNVIKKEIEKRIHAQGSP